LHAPEPHSSVTTHRRGRAAVIAGALGVIVGLAFSTVGSAQPAPPEEPPSTTEPADPVEAPATAPPVTERPVTEPAETQPPVTEPPVMTDPNPVEPPATADPGPAPTEPPPAARAPADPPAQTVPARDEPRPAIRPTPIPPPARERRAGGRLPDPAGGPWLDEDGNTVLGSSSLRHRDAVAGDAYVVQVANNSTLAAVTADLADAGVTITNTLNGDFVGLTADLDRAAAARLRHRPGVVRVERDQRIELSGTQSSPPWNLDRIDQRRRPLDGRYSSVATGGGVTAYIIDSGIRPTHADFGGRVKRWAYWDFGDGTQGFDCNGHGTHVAGTIGGATWGVAKAVNIVPVKAFACSGSTYDSIILEAIYWVIADHPYGAPAVLNMSLGGPVSSIVDEAVNDLIRDGITVVVAAGNDAAPSCYKSPARVPAAITVAASTSRDDDAWFSNHGACNDLFAPGVDIRSASHLSNTGSTVMSGTSMAAPHVAGAAALYLQNHRSASPAQVWSAINADTTRGAISVCCGDPDKLLFVSSAPGALSAPRSLTARPGDRAVRLSWAAPWSNGGAPIIDYRIQRSADGRRTWTTVADGVSSARRATVGRLTNGHRYYFRVAARNRAGIGPWSRAVSAVPATRPTAPRSLTARPGDRRVALSWAAPSSNGGAPITDYRVQRSADGGRTWWTVADGVSSVRRATVGGLTNGRRYYFRVAARNRVGVGPWSRAVSVIPVTRPSAPRSVIATSADSAIRLSWAAPSSNGGAPITDYRVQRSADGGRTWWTVADGVSSVRRAAVGGLTNGRRYYFRVAARNRVGVGPWSRAVSAIPATRPSAPRALTAAGGDGVVSLTWTAPSSNGGAAITDYVIQRSTNGGATWVTVADGISIARSATVRDLTNGQLYHFRVAARNRIGTGSWSAAAFTSPLESVEDDGSIPLAGVTGIGAGKQSFSTSGVIGDGPHGSSASGTGDFDFYRVDLVAGELLIAETSTSVGGLDTTISVYDSTGWEVAYDDDSGSDGNESRVEFTAPEDGAYYVAVSGYYVYQYDPFDSGSGDGAATEGPYTLTITATG
jgi:subtilisin family serine protease